MKKYIIIIATMLNVSIYAQVGINTQAPRATLEIKSVKKRNFNNGIIIPVTTKENLDKVTDLVKPTLVYVENIDYTSNNDKLAGVTKEGFYYYDGVEWKGLSEIDINAVIAKLYPKLEGNYFQNIYNYQGKVKIGIATGKEAKDALEVSSETSHPLIVNSTNSNGGGIAIYNSNFDNKIEIGANYNGDFFIRKNSINNLWISSSGNIGIGTSSPEKKLEVNGDVRASAFYGTAPSSIFPDYVFQSYYTGKSLLNPEYKFSSLKEVEKFIKEKGHLPNYPSVKEITRKGYVDITKIQLTNVEKIEELYLHNIEQEKQIKLLQDKIEKQTRALEKLYKLIIEYTK